MSEAYHPSPADRAKLDAIKAAQELGLSSTIPVSARLVNSLNTGLEGVNTDANTKVKAQVISGGTVGGIKIG
jgi:hypothetical protein